MTTYLIMRERVAKSRARVPAVQHLPTVLVTTPINHSNKVMFTDNFGKFSRMILTLQNEFWSKGIHIFERIDHFPPKLMLLAECNGQKKYVVLIKTHVRSCAFPMMNNPILALDSATQILLLAFKNPMMPSLLLLTRDNKMISFSSP